MKSAWLDEFEQLVLWFGELLFSYFRLRIVSQPPAKSFI